MSRTTTTIEYFALDGPIHLAIVLGLAAVVAVLFVWSLRREQHVLGKRNAILFGVLRLVALATVIWMLLAPSTIRSEKSRIRKSVAMVVDVSPSMLTVDPPIDGEDARWTIATGGEARSSTLASVDRALAAAALAERRLDEATRAIRNQQNERIALEAAATAHDAVERVKENTRTLVDALDSRSPSSSSKSEDQVRAVARILDGPGFDRLAKLADGFRRGHDSFPSGWRESLTDLEHQITGVRRRLGEISQSIGESDELVSNEIDSTDLNVTRQSPRLDRVASLMRAMDGSTLRSVREIADVRQVAFDENVILVKGQDITDQLGELAARARLGVAGDQRVGDPQPTTDVSAALEKLRQTSEEQPLAAVFLFTDAAHNRPDAPDPRIVAARLAGTPVYVVPLGTTRHARDVDLKAISAPGVVMKDDEVVVEVTLQAFQCEGESLRIELLQDGEVLQDREITIDSEIAVARLRFNTQLAELGPQRFQVRAVPLDGELSEDNNFNQFEINVTRDRINLLLADELPRWEFRYLAQLFRRDAKVECDELLFHPRRLATGSRGESKAFPATADEWDRYDVVLLGDVSSENLPVESQRSLVEFVRERGGTLVIVAGSEYMPAGYVNQPLEDLLPVTKAEASAAEPRDGYLFQVTDEGARHHALMIADTEDATRMAWDFINRNSPLYSLSEYRQAKPSARTLIAAVPRSSGGVPADPNDSALLCWHPIGRGRVVYLASPETYRLRFLRGDRLHYRFWGQLLRWAIASDLAGGNELVSIRTDQADYRSGDSVPIVVRLRDESGNAVADGQLEAVAVDADDVRTTIPLRADASAPGRYVGNFERLPSGIYRVEPTGADVTRLLEIEANRSGEAAPVAASFTVRAPANRELLDTRSDRALAQQIAQATGGQVLQPTAIGEVLNLTNLQPMVTEKTEALPLWVQWKFLWLVFGCLFTEWSIRKWMGIF